MVRLAVPAPLSGPLAPLGRDLAAGVGLAVADAAPGLERAGLRVEAVPFDESRVAAAIGNAELICSAPLVVAVVGHLESAAAIPASERYHQCGLALVAPASTAPELTDRGLPGVFRLLPRDETQAELAAAFARERLRARRAFIVHDGTVYGQGLADAFKVYAEERGMRIVGYRRLSRGRGSPESLAAEAARRAPDVLYFGGTYADASPFLAAVRAAGVAAPLLGGDGLDVPWMRDAPGGRGVYVTGFGARLRGTEAGRRWAARFQGLYGREPAPVAAYAYDAARLVLAALGDEARAGRPARREGLAAAVRRRGGAGGVAVDARFDARGDNVLAAETLEIRLCRADGCQPAEAGLPARPAPSRESAGRAETP